MPRRSQQQHHQKQLHQHQLQDNQLALEYDEPGRANAISGSAPTPSILLRLWQEEGRSVEHCAIPDTGATQTVVPIQLIERARFKIDYKSFTRHMETAN